MLKYPKVTIQGEEWTFDFNNKQLIGKDGTKVDLNDKEHIYKEVIKQIGALEEQVAVKSLNVGDKVWAVDPDGFPFKDVIGTIETIIEPNNQYWVMWEYESEPQMVHDWDVMPAKVNEEAGTGAAGATTTATFQPAVGPAGSASKSGSFPGGNLKKQKKSEQIIRRDPPELKEAINFAERMKNSSLHCN